MSVAQSEPRRSIGGRVVEDSLTAVGFETSRKPGLAMVETARPGRRPFTTVLAQNAWNTVSNAEFVHRVRKYPSPMIPRVVARRAIARVNLARAERVVCLTHAMADMCRPLVRGDLVVSPVTVPLDAATAGPRSSASHPGGRTVLVPGTVAWYKDPLAAIDVAVASVENPQVLFAGGDDGSGCWDAVADRCRKIGVEHERATFPRSEMIDAFQSAALVVIPSQMESLSFGLGEALLLAEQVIASPIPAHREVASRLGREPRWLSGGSVTQSEPTNPVLTLELVRRFDEEWRALGRCLGLGRDASGSGVSAP